MAGTRGWPWVSVSLDSDDDRPDSARGDSRAIAMVQLFGGKAAVSHPVPGRLEYGKAAVESVPSSASKTAESSSQRLRSWLESCGRCLQSCCRCRKREDDIEQQRSSSQMRKT